MLIIPFVKAPDWRHPPFVTLLLIIVNVALFAGFQADDDKVERRALDYYRSSVLPETELPRYLTYLETMGHANKASALRSSAAQGNIEPVLMRMEHDTDFMRLLRTDHIVRPDDAMYTHWRQQRQTFESMRRASFTERFAFRSTTFEPVTLVTHMFLHANWDHLIGNMIFLALFGYLVEELLGALRYLAFYLISGVGSILMFWRFMPQESALALGASGAIAGVMAMYAVLFGLRKINFFYWVVVYFDVFKARAIVVLPVYLAVELYQLMFTQSNVNYLAHIGGLLSGTLLAGAHRYRYRAALDTYHANETTLERQAADYPRDMARAREHVANLRFDAALKLYEFWLTRRPDDRELMVLCYNVARHIPHSEFYHRAALRILSLNARDRGTAALVHETFAEYLRVAKPAARLTPMLQTRLARRFCDDGRLQDAERLMSALLKQRPTDETPALVMRLADAYERAGDTVKHAEWIDTVRTRFPHSELARLKKTERSATRT